MVGSSSQTVTEVLEAAHDKMDELYRFMHSAYAYGLSRSKVRRAMDQYDAAVDAYEALLALADTIEVDNG